MKKSELEELIQGNVVELLRTDVEIKTAVVKIIKENPVILKNILSEIVRENPGFIAEALKPEPDISNSDPDNAELWDNIVLIAEGKVSSVKNNGKILRSPNHGMGFKSKKNIQEWVSKAYTKIGGNWVSKGGGSFERQGSHSFQKQENISALQNFMGSFDGQSADNGSVIAMAAASGNEQVVRQKLAENGNGSFKDLETGESHDISEILMDTAKTTLVDQINHKDAQYSDASSLKVSQSTPEELFGTDMAGNWESLAFQK